VVVHRIVLELWFNQASELRSTSRTRSQVFPRNQDGIAASIDPFQCLRMRKKRQMTFEDVEANESGSNFERRINDGKKQRLWAPWHEAWDITRARKMSLSPALSGFLNFTFQNLAPALFSNPGWKHASMLRNTHCLTRYIRLAIDAFLPFDQVMLNIRLNFQNRRVVQQ
jgi:hypothetical protein